MGNALSALFAKRIESPTAYFVGGAINNEERQTRRIKQEGIAPMLFGVYMNAGPCKPSVDRVGPR